MVANKKEKNKTQKTTFTKQQWLNSKKYLAHGDVLSSMLKDGSLYSNEEVENLIEKFMKGQVK